METTPTFRGFSCRSCGSDAAPEIATDRCPDCDGLLVAEYDADATTERYRTDGLDAFLPIDRDAVPDLDEGGTPAVDCPSLATDLGIASVRIKDEGRNPTGSVRDREMALAIGAAAAGGADAVALPTTGNGGQSAAAYAGRAGLDSTSFVPTRCPFVNKAMVNVHGGEMSVVEGRYADALAAFEEADVASDAADATRPLTPASPYRREGVVPLLGEFARESTDGTEDDPWTLPDAIVVPTGHGTTVAGLRAGIERAERAGLLAETPRLYAAQPAGCAPIVDAWREDAEPIVEHPDTIVGPLEVGEPACAPLVLDALAATDGGAVAVADDDVLAAGVDAASETGVEVGATGGVAVAAALDLADDGALGAGDDVVLVNPVAASKEADLLRSYLMSQGM